MVALLPVRLGRLLIANDAGVTDGAIFGVSLSDDTLVCRYIDNCAGLTWHRTNAC